MSHFAKINAQGVVESVVVAEQDFIDIQPGLWLKTSYTASIRGKFAGVGDLYDAENDVFVSSSVQAPTGNMPP